MNRATKHLDKTEVEDLKSKCASESAESRVIKNYTDLADEFTRNNGFYKSFILKVLQNQQRLELKMLELERKAG